LPYLPPLPHGEANVLRSVEKLTELWVGVDKSSRLGVMSGNPPPHHNPSPLTAVTPRCPCLQQTKLRNGSTQPQPFGDRMLPAEVLDTEQSIWNLDSP